MKKAKDGVRFVIRKADGSAILELIFNGEHRRLRVSGEYADQIVREKKVPSYIEWAPNVIAGRLA